MDSMQFPDRPEALTAEWMSSALGFDVRRVEILDQHSGTTGRVRLGLECDSGGPSSVFVKLPPFNERQRKLVAMTDMGRKEARFYAEVASEVPMRIPRSLHATFGQEPTEYVIVLEDLQAAGCRFAKSLEQLVDDHGGKLIEGLARLHAHFWNDARFESELSWLRPAGRGSYGAKLIDSARQQFADEFPPVFAELCSIFVDHHDRIADILDEGEHTLIHGDTHGGNQFVDGDEVGLYDWAVISRSPGIRDVAIYLGNSCPTEVRRAGQEEWIRRYQQVLVGAGVDAPSFDTLWTRYRRSVMYAWVAATTTAAMGDRWQPIAVGMAGMKRATETCADLETVEALRDALR